MTAPTPGSPRVAKVRHRPVWVFLAWILAALAGGTAGAPALASRLTAHIGPPSAGGGGANPVSIPPTSPGDWEFTYVTDRDFETNLAITPGILCGQRSSLANGVYVSFGGGLVINQNGAGPGAYSAVGWDSGWFNIEYKQAIGFDFATNSSLNPYAVRLGMTFEF